MDSLILDTRSLPSSFRSDSEQLDEFLRGDFSSMDSEISAVFTRVENRPASRPIPLVNRFASYLSPHYVLAPSRSFSADGRLMLELYNDAGVDITLRSLTRSLVCQRTQVVSVIPRRSGGVRLQVWAPFETDITFDDPNDDDIREAARVEFIAPTRTLDWGVETGKYVYTRDMAWVENNDGRFVRGLFAKDGRNPYGFIPLVAIRSADAIKGLWFAPINEALFNHQIGVNLVFSFLEDLCRKQGFTRHVMTGPSAALAIAEHAYGPGLSEAFPGEEITHTMITPNPPVEKILAALRTTIEVFAANSWVSAQAILNSSAITGDAKAWEVHDQEEHRREQTAVLRRFEQQLGELVREVRAPRGRLLTRLFQRDLRVSVEYREVEVRTNPLQKAQSRALDLEHVLDSPQRILARRLGISLSDAKKVMVEIAQELEEFASARKPKANAPGPEAVNVPNTDNNVPGLDKLAVVQ